MGAQLQLIAFSLAALKFLAILVTDKVDHHSVAFGGFTIDLNGGLCAVDIGSQSNVHIVFGHFCVLVGRNNALVIFNSDFGSDRNISVDDNAFGADRFHMHFRIADDLQIFLIHSVLHCLGADVIDGIFIEQVCAIHLFDQLSRCLALPEAGDIQLVLHSAVNRFNSSVKFICFDLDGHSDHAVFQFFYVFHIHGCLPPKLVRCADIFRYINLYGQPMVIQIWCISIVLRFFILTDIEPFFYRYLKIFCVIWAFSWAR